MGRLGRAASAFFGDVLYGTFVSEEAMSQRVRERKAARTAAKKRRREKERELQQRNRARTQRRREKERARARERQQQHTEALNEQYRQQTAKYAKQRDQQLRGHFKAQTEAREQHQAWLDGKPTTGQVSAIQRIAASRGFAPPAFSTARQASAWIEQMTGTTLRK